MQISRNIKGIYLIQRVNVQENKEEPLYYVGLAVDIFDRWKQHCNGNKQHIDKSIQKNGCLNFIFKILEEVTKEIDLKGCETKWINFYKENFSEKLMFNINETSNINPHKIDTNIKTEIKKLFEEEIGRSIYAISEKYNLKWKDITSIRKPLLKRYGLTYDNVAKKIVDANGQTPDNWKGDRITKSLSEKILSLKKQNKKDDRDIANECNLSITDLKQFFVDYEINKNTYDFADTINNKTNKEKTTAS